MNREILFRGREEVTGVWRYGFWAHLPSAGGSAHIIYEPAGDPDDSNHARFVDPSTIGQYTGLKDRNGRRIFEGDILSFNDSDGDQVLCTALWRDHRWMVQEHEAFYVDPDDLDNLFCEYAEVVGNIHDNSELWRRHNNEK